MIQSINPTSPAGVKLLTVFRGTKIGSDVALESFGNLCPAFGEDCKGRLVETRGTPEYYEVQVTWFDIPVCTVSADLTRKTLNLEVIK